MNNYIAFQQGIIHPTLGAVDLYTTSTLRMEHWHFPCNLKFMEFARVVWNRFEYDLKVSCSVYSFIWKCGENIRFIFEGKY